MLNPQLLTVIVPETHPTYRPLAEIFQAGQAAMPKKAVNTFADYPRNEAAAFKLMYALPVADAVTESGRFTSTRIPRKSLVNA